MVVLPGTAAAVSADRPDPEVVRKDLLFLLDNSEAILQYLNIQPFHQARIDQAREQVMIAPASELEAIPTELYRNMRLMSLSATQMRLNHNQAGPPGKGGGNHLNSQSPVTRLQSSLAPLYVGSDLVQPLYPDFTWFAEFDWTRIENGLLFLGIDLICSIIDCDGMFGDYESFLDDRPTDHCEYPGISYENRVATLNLALTAEGVKDAAEQICGQDFFGFSVSVACIVTDVIWILAETVEQQEELCNDSIGAAQVEATWDGLQTIHGNVQNVFETLNTHDLDIATQLAGHDTDLKAQLTSHDTDVKAQVTTHDDDMKALISEMLGNQATIIELLNTPSGRRPDWPIQP